MIKGLKCDLSAFQMVTNALYETSSTITIRYPPIGDILTINKRRKEVKIKLISRKDYTEKYTSICSKYPECDREIPTYENILEAVYCGGIPPLDDVEELLMKEISQHDVFRGHKPLWIGYDTCVLRRRFHANIHRFLESNRLSGALGHTVAKGVYDELHNGMDKKYQARQVQLLKDHFREAGEFFNQLTLEARLHQIGLLDINAIKKHDVFQLISSGRDDINIIDGYSEFEDHRKAEVLLFSADSNFIQMAMGNSLNAHLVKYTSQSVIDYLHDKSIGLDRVNSLLYHLAIVCGFIRTRGVSIYSIWSGKDAHDWRNGYVMVVPEGNLKDQLKKDHAILSVMKVEKIC